MSCRYFYATNSQHNVAVLAIVEFQMMRIALVTPMLPIPHDQTRGRFIHETAKSLSKIADVKVFFQQISYPKLPFVAPRSFIEGCVGQDYTLDGVDVEAFTYPAFPVISRAVNGYVASLGLTKRVKRFQPELVLAYWVYPDGFAAQRTARELGVPCVIGALGSDIHVRSGLNVAMTRRVIERADALLTVSEAMRQTAINDFGADPARAHTITNGFNTGVFHLRSQQDIRDRLGISLDEKLVIYVGRFVEAKGLRELLSAFQRMAQRDPDVGLVLVGDGVMKAELLSLVKDSGVAARVRMPGGLPPEQVAEWVSAADVLTLPSWSEGYPNVVVEGVACGRPVVATDVGGTREILNDANGILIPPKNVEALERALVDALSREWDHAAIANKMQRTWDNVAEETLWVCQKVSQEFKCA